MGAKQYENNINSLNRYKKEKRLGKGIFSEVFKVKDKTDGKIYALKCIS